MCDALGVPASHTRSSKTHADLVTKSAAAMLRLLRLMLRRGLMRQALASPVVLGVGSSSEQWSGGLGQEQTGIPSTHRVLKVRG